MKMQAEENRNGQIPEWKQARERNTCLKIGQQCITSLVNVVISVIIVSKNIDSKLNHTSHFSEI